MERTTKHTPGPRARHWTPRLNYMREVGECKSIAHLRGLAAEVGYVARGDEGFAHLRHIIYTTVIRKGLGLPPRFAGKDTQQ